MRRVIGIGETLLDIIFKDNKPHTAIPGGSVFNGSVSLSRLGIPVDFIGDAGLDRVGQFIADFMKENGMTTEYLNFFSDGRSPLSLAFLNESNDAEYLFYTDYPKHSPEIILPKISQDDIVILGSYYALNPLHHERIVELLDDAKKNRAIVYYDLNFRKAHAHEIVKIRPIVMDNYEYASIVRGSEEDFLNLYGKTDMEKVYKDEVAFYCQQLITTHGTGGVHIFTKKLQTHYDVPHVVEPVSTIGAGDNFNAGIVYGLIKYNIKYTDIPNLSDCDWSRIVHCGMDLATEACLSYSNYISQEFASAYQTL
ncbi:MAG: carbohydrate kinase [Tannerella sp.]|jgi:fructokinase|nr:carbohydrate kinase [Tannerella sp.]